MPFYNEGSKANFVKVFNEKLDIKEGARIK